MFVHSYTTIVYTFTAWTIFLMNFWKKKRLSIFFLKFYTENTYIINLGLPVNLVRWKRKISPLSFFSWQLNAKNRFSISSLVFPQSSWEGVTHLKKNYLSLIRNVTFHEINCPNNQINKKKQANRGRCQLAGVQNKFVWYLSCFEMIVIDCWIDMTFVSQILQQGLDFLHWNWIISLLNIDKLRYKLYHIIRMIYSRVRRGGETHAKTYVSLRNRPRI